MRKGLTWAAASTSNTGWNVCSKTELLKEFGPESICPVISARLQHEFTVLWNSLHRVCSGDRAGQAIRPHACLVMSSRLEFWQRQGQTRWNGCPRQRPDFLGRLSHTDLLWITWGYGKLLHHASSFCEHHASVTQP